MSCSPKVSAYMYFIQKIQVPNKNILLSHKIINEMEHINLGNFFKSNGMCLNGDLSLKNFYE